MLLRDYLLLNLGRVTAEYLAAWQSDMAGRRRVDATRDLLARYHLADGELLATAILEPRRALPGAPELEAGLRAAASSTAGRYPEGVSVQAVTAAAESGVLIGRVTLQVAPPADRRAVANALAYYFEEAFGYARASQHPVAFEESLRPS